MRKIFWTTAILALLSVSACVTINVYFPAAAAEEAANQFIDQVIGTPSAASDPAAPGTPPDQQPPKLSQLFAIIPAAQAQANLDISTPAIKAIQARMSARFQGTLEPHFTSGALGFTRDGLVAVRDAAAIPLSARAPVNQAVAEENRDRAAVYREIAVANGHPEWEAEIRATFAKQWIERAGDGWYHQDESGAWKQK